MTLSLPFPLLVAILEARSPQMPQIMQALADFLFYAICIGLALWILNNGDGGGKRARLPVA
jgi:hypothetical protein